MSVMGNFKKWLKNLKKKSFPAYRSSWGGELTQMDSSSFPNTPFISWNSEGITANAKYPEEYKDTRIEKKPVEVVKEILSEKPVISCKDLDKQIKVIEKRIKVFKEQNCGCNDEMLALKFLKARKKIKFYDKFNWPTTTDDKIRELCKTYKLQMVGFQSYAKNVPMKAVDELEKYAAAYEKVSSDKPNLQLIIDVGGKEQKKDPILLAGSPFGRWYHVLGAWDKEVQYVDDLVYKGK